MLSGAPQAGSVSDSNVPQAPGAFLAPSGLGADPNQVTTKPRQLPGGSGGPGGQPGGGEPFDPTANGSEGGPNSSLPNDPGGAGGADAGGVDAQRATSAKIVAMMDAVQADNPEVDRRAAYLLAKAAINTYPMLVTAEGMNPLEFGHRGEIPDGPLHKKVLEYDSGPLKGWLRDTFQDIRDWSGHKPSAQPEPAPAHRQAPYTRTQPVEHPEQIPSGATQPQLGPGMDNGKVIPGQVIEGRRLAEHLSLLEV